MCGTAGVEDAGQPPAMVEAGCDGVACGACLSEREKEEERGGKEED